jgi:hypothetical protein
VGRPLDGSQSGKVGETVNVTCAWDSGPFSAFYATDEPVRIDPHGHNTVAVPKDVWDRYLTAEAEFHAAEDALWDAERAFLKKARASDPLRADDR